MNEETNDSGIHTWVDLLNSEETSGSSDGSRSRRVKISSHTPRSDRTASRLTGQAVHREAGQAEGLRAQIMALLKEKQEMRKKVCNDVQIVCCYALTTWKMIVMAMCVCVCSFPRKDGSREKSQAAVGVGASWRCTSGYSIQGMYYVGLDCSEGSPCPFPSFPESHSSGY